MTTTLAYSLAGAADAAGMSRSSIERAIKAGHLKAKKSSKDDDGNPIGSWVITAAALQSFIDGLPDA